MKLRVRDVALNVLDQGDPNGQPVVFANALGTDLRIWDQVVPLLPDHLRIIRYDTRGHGDSDSPPGPYTMGQLVTDAEQALDTLGVKSAIFVGLSVGGMIAQGLAVKRHDLIRALVLSNTAAKFGTKEIWQDRIATIRTGGIESIADTMMQRWFSRPFLNGPELPFWRDMLTGQPVEGYLGCCAAIAGTDMYTPTSGLRLPTLGISGDADGSTPPDLVRETLDLIPGSRFHIMRGVGHLPCVEKPAEYAKLLTEFTQGD